MTTEKDTPHNSSRRSFVQTVAAALIAAPILSSNIQLFSSSAKGNAKPVTHGPPIIIDDGSLKIETLEDFNDATEPRAPFKYVSKSTNTNMAFVHVVTEQDEAVTTTVVPPRGVLPEGCKLLLYFERIPKTGARREDSTPSVTVVSGNPYSIETAERLQAREDSNRKARIYRRKYADLLATDPDLKEFRIFKWEIKNSKDTVIHSGSLAEGKNDDFKFLITFNHT